MGKMAKISFGSNSQTQRPWSPRTEPDTADTRPIADLRSRWRGLARSFTRLTIQFRPREGVSARPVHDSPRGLRACMETQWGPVFAEKAAGRGASEGASLPHARDDRASNPAERDRPPFPRKPSGRRSFCPPPALARPFQPALGMLRSRRLGGGQKSSSQDPIEFPYRL